MLVVNALGREADCLASPIRVVMAGATGKTGKAVTRVILQQDDMKLVGAVAADHIGVDVGTVIGVDPVGVTIQDDLTKVLDSAGADVLVDFTAPAVVVSHIEKALDRGVACVVGTTGISREDAQRLGQKALEKEVALCIIANFSIGVMLLNRFAKEAAKFFPKVEIIEKHHDTKVDAPSGTALFLGESIKTVTGREVPMHSVRLPGFIAHHDLYFSSAGENLTIIHDTVSREAFGPGVVQTIRAIRRLRGLVTDFEEIFNESPGE